MNASIDTTTMMLITVVMIPIVGIMMAIIPYLMRRGEVFAVTVPEAAQNDLYLKGLKRHYLYIMMAATLVLTVLSAVFAFSGNELGSIVLVAAGTLFVCIFGYALMLHYRQKVRRYKKEQDWEAVQQEKVAVVGNEAVPQAISLKWNLLYLVVMAITLAIGFAGYSQMPNPIPTHMGFGGEVDGWTDKTPFIVWMPVLIQAFMAVCFFFSHWMIMRAKRQPSPNAPATSALAYGLFARAQSIYLLVLGLIICVAMISMPLSFMGIITLMQASVFVLVGALIAVVGAIALSVVYGQGGSRVFARMQESSTMLVDDDQYWKLGIFYFNREDPSLFLLERFGVGWTVNWARPAVWLILVGGLAVTVAFIVAVAVLF